MSALQQQCAVRKAERKAERLTETLHSVRRERDLLKQRIRDAQRRAERQQLRAIVSEQSADRICRAITETAEMSDEDKRLILALDKEGVSMREIAEKFETDLLTVACVAEGWRDGLQRKAADNS